METKFLSTLKKSTAFGIFSRDIPDSFSHSYLIVSDDKAAVESLLTLLCQRVYCKQGGCGCCAECQKVVDGVNIDLKELNPDGSAVSVKDVSEIIGDAAMTSFLGGQKLYVFRNVENSSEVTQNKLLKTLEEPAPGVHFIMTTAVQQGVLPTIRSRTRQITLSAFPQEDVTEAMLGLGYAKEDVREAVRIASGSLTTAEKLLSDGKYFSLSAELIAVLGGLSEKNMIEYLQRELFSAKELADTLDFLEMIFQDLMRLSGGGELSFERQAGELRALKQRYNGRTAALCMSAVGEARAMLKANCGAESVAHLLLMNILEVTNANRNRS